MGRRRLIRTLREDSSDEDQQEQPAPPSAKKRKIELSDEEHDAQSSTSVVLSPSAARSHGDMDSGNTVNHVDEDDCRHLTPEEVPASLPVNGDGTKPAAAGAIAAAEASARNIRGTRVASRRGNYDEDDGMAKMDLGKGLERAAVVGDGDPQVESDQEAEWDAPGTAEHKETVSANDFDDDDGDGDGSDAQEEEGEEYGTATGNGGKSKGKGKQRATTYRRGVSSSDRQLRSHTEAIGLTLAGEDNFPYRRASRSRAGGAKRENEPLRQSQRLASRGAIGSGVEEIGRRPRRAAATKNIDYARLNEGEELDDSASNEDDDDDDGRRDDNAKSRKKASEEDDEYVQTSSGEEGDKEGGASDAFPGVEDSDDSGTARGYGGRGNKRKILLRSSSRRTQQEEEKEEGEDGDEDDEDERDLSRAKRNRQARYQQQRKRRKVVADTDSDEAKWQGEEDGLEAVKRQREYSENNQDDHDDEGEKEYDDDGGGGDDDDEEEEEEEEGLSHGQILYMQQMEEDEADATTFLKNMTPSTPGELEDASESFGWYVEFLAKAVQGGGRGKAFMERFCSTSSRNDFVDYRRAIKKFEGHLSTVRESIVGGSWNQEFKTVVVSYPFVGFSRLEYDPNRADGFNSHDDMNRCAACHRKQCANVYAMYVAGNNYDSNGMWTRQRWDKLLPNGWADADGMEDSKAGVLERLELGGTCKFKAHLYHTLRHYKLYLVCKIRSKMDDEDYTPEMFRKTALESFCCVEKEAIDQVVKLAKEMEGMEYRDDDWKTKPREGAPMIRRWLAVPKDVVDEEDAKYEENRFKRFSDSSEQDGDSDDGAANDKDEGDQAGASSDKGRAGGGSKWWGRTTRYGEPQSEDSDDFIVDG